MSETQHPKTPLTESLVREIISTYNHYKGQYRVNSLIRLTPDEIINQITKDLNDKNQFHGATKR